ncbi:MAG TPA: 3-dehydroquinate synthase [bacterium]
MVTVKVELGNQTYPVFVGSGILDKLGEMYQLYDFGEQVVVITDTVVRDLYSEQLRERFRNITSLFEVVAVPPGEASKSLKVVDELITKMLEIGFDRQATVIGFGGGVIGDIAGFVASIYKRGVRLIQAPTTLLAQVDASIGGKTGVNHPLGKNMIGTFYQPQLVWSDLALLKTLPRREIVCGLGEVIKYGIIRDPFLFALVEHTFEEAFTLDLPLMEEIVKRCCEIKAKIVSVDEKERDQRMILNFGHTIGHALESALNYEVSHGEAVLLGMVAESKIAMDLEKLPRDEFLRIKNLIARFDWQAIPKHLNIEHLMTFLQRDKKAVAGRIKFVFPTRIGDVFITEQVDMTFVHSAIHYLFNEVVQSD